MKNWINVLDCGAKGDGVSNDQLTIQATVDECFQRGGDTVCFPSGYYLSGQIILKDNVTVYLEPGAVILVSKDERHYAKDSDEKSLENCLFIANNARNIAVIGDGTIDGQGIGNLRNLKEQPQFRTGVILFQSCENIKISGVHIINSDMWTIHLKRCDTVYIDCVTIKNNLWRLNTDGIDPVSCRNVHISNCHIRAGDDCIVVKTSGKTPCENIVVTNCTLETTCTGIKLGTETDGDFRNIHFSNCTVRYLTTGIGFFVKDGALIERITFSNITLEDLNIDISKRDTAPIFLDIERRHQDSLMGKIRDIIFRDVCINTGAGILIQGAKESTIDNLILQNIIFRVDKSVDYNNRIKHVGGIRTAGEQKDTCYARIPSYITAAHIRDFTLDNVKLIIAKQVFKEHPRYLFYGTDVEQEHIHNANRMIDGEEEDFPAIYLNGHNVCSAEGNR